MNLDCKNKKTRITYMSKKKERTYNSYRIEQLGPRLMMDATVSD